MRLAVYVKDESHRKDARYADFLRALSWCEVYQISGSGDLSTGTDMLLSVGGDGTFLSAASMAAEAGVPVLGVNFGRLGFLSENKPEEVPSALSSGQFAIEEREMLHASVDGRDEGFALNEISVRRRGPAMLGVDVTVGGESLPTYWADGLLVATSSGSTAYALSVGGPICTPDAGVLVIAPIAPHNLNVRPLIVPSSREIGISLRSRDGDVCLAVDNRDIPVTASASIRISLARFSLKRVRLSRSNFIGALQEKLFWGEDVRNGSER